VSDLHGAAVLCYAMWVVRSLSAGAQGACGQLAAHDSAQGCRALVPACAGLVPFVVAALRKLVEFCARPLLPGGAACVCRGAAMLLRR